MDVELDLQSALERIRGPRRGTESEEPTGLRHRNQHLPIAVRRHRTAW